MTDEEFLAYFAGGLDIQGHRVTARRGNLGVSGLLDPSVRDRNGLLFLLRIDFGAEFPIAFTENESRDSRLAKIDAAVTRWRVLRPG